MSVCNICPRHCNIERRETQNGSGQLGVCGMGRLPVVARAGIHHWEEPCISGTRGSGTVFFSGCNLKCCFCQNYKISTQGFGKEITVTRLREIYYELIEKGVHNINLVSPTHYIEAVAQSLCEPLPVPVVYNSSGYESANALKQLDGKVQIYLPDFKYSDNDCAVRYSKADHYYGTAADAIYEMYRQVGSYRINDEGLLQSGVVIRHMILPNNIENTLGVIDWVADHFKNGEVLFSLMCQYVPCGKAADYPEINRVLTPEEYKRVEDYLFYSGIEDGFLQEQEAASCEFIPDFDLSGV